MDQPVTERLMNPMIQPRSDSRRPWSFPSDNGRGERDFPREMRDAADLRERQRRDEVVALDTALRQMLIILSLLLGGVLMIGNFPFAEVTRLVTGLGLFLGVVGILWGLRPVAATASDPETESDPDADHRRGLGRKQVALTYARRELFLTFLFLMVMTVIRYFG